MELGKIGQSIRETMQQAVPSKEQVIEKLPSFSQIAKVSAIASLSLTAYATYNLVEHVPVPIIHAGLNVIGGALVGRGTAAVSGDPVVGCLLMGTGVSVIALAAIDLMSYCTAEVTLVVTMQPMS
ncbi:MAG: hypothetical protein S4CHLAM123_02870 [Chlamydiales bacterium]|nr:hypothetical protein [Chlamydiales bacterium]